MARVCFPFCQFPTNKLCLIAYIFAQVGSKFCQILNMPSKNCVRVKFFCQSGEISPNIVALLLNRRPVLSFKTRYICHSDLPILLFLYPTNLYLGLFFIYFPSFQTVLQNESISHSTIPNWIVRVEGERADHLTTTTTTNPISYICSCFSILSFSLSFPLILPLFLNLLLHLFLNLFFLLVSPSLFAFISFSPLTLLCDSISLSLFFLIFALSSLSSFHFSSWRKTSKK